MPKVQQGAKKGVQQATKPALGKLVLPKISNKPDSALKINTICPGSIFEVYGVLNAAEAARFVDAVEHSGLLTHQSSRGPKYGEAFRDNERVSVQDEAFAQHLWQASGLQRHFATWPSDGGRPVGLNPNIRIYRYGTGQRFGKHIDESCETGPGQYTRFTLLIYLTGNVGGGETVFYDERSRLLCRVAPETGKALLHVHGDDCLEHEGAVVRAGLKYVLRSDVVFTKVS